MKKKNRRKVREIRKKYETVDSLSFPYSEKWFKSWEFLFQASPLSELETTSFLPGIQAVGNCKDTGTSQERGGDDQLSHFSRLLCKFQNRKQKILSSPLSLPECPWPSSPLSGSQPHALLLENCAPHRVARFSVNSAGTRQADPSNFPSDDSSSDATDKR